MNNLEPLEIKLEPEKRKSRRARGRYILTLANNSDIPLPFSLITEDIKNECVIETSNPENLLKNIGSNEKISLNLTVKPLHRNWVGREVEHDFTVKVNDYTESAIFTQRCALPLLYWAGLHWKLLLGVLVLLAGLFVTFQLFFQPQLFSPQTAEAIKCGLASTQNFELVVNGPDSFIYVNQKEVLSENSAKLPGLYESLIALSADGRRMAYVTADNLALDNAVIHGYDFLTKAQFTIASASVSRGLWPVAPVWSADGTKLVFVTRPTTSAATPLVKTTSSPESNPTTTLNSKSDAAQPAPPLELNFYKVSYNGSAKAGEEQLTSELLSKLSNEKLTTKLFYGDKASALCWSADNKKLFVKDQKDIKYEIDTSSGKAENFVVIPDTNSTPTSAGSSISTNSQNSNGNNCNFDNLFSQNDPRWATQILRNDQLANVGCSLTAAAILLNAVKEKNDKFFSPDQLGNNDCLKEDRIIQLDSSDWGKLTSCLKPNSDKDKKRPEIKYDDFSWYNLNEALKNGPAIVGLLGGQSSFHFLVVNSKSHFKSNILVSDEYNLADEVGVIDPWDGTDTKTLGYFLSKGYILRWLIQLDKPACTLSAPSTPKSQKSIESIGNYIQIKGGIQDGLAYKDNLSFSYNKKPINESPGNQMPITNLEVTKVYIPAIEGKPELSQKVTEPLMENTTYKFIEEGLYSIKIKAIGTELPLRTLHFVIDKTPPELRVEINNNQAIPKENLYTTPVNFKLFATDYLSGITSIEYIKNSPIITDITNWIPYTSDTAKYFPQLAENKTYSLKFRATNGVYRNVQTYPEPPYILTTKFSVVGSGSEKPIDSLVDSLAITVNITITGPTPPPNGNPAVGGVPSGGGTSGSGGSTTSGGVTSATRAPAPVPGNSGGSNINIPGGGGTTTTPPANATTSIAPTPGKPVLEVSTAQITFGPGIINQTVELKNTGTDVLNWSIDPGTAKNIFSFSPITSGKLNPQSGILLTISPLSSNTTTQNQVVNFQVNSDGGKAVIVATTTAQPLPTALFISPANGPLVSPVTVKLAISGQQQPNHATLVATYKTCATCFPGNFTLPQKPSPQNSWTISWDTTQIVPQTGISLKGKLCTSSDDSVCTVIPSIINLSVEGPTNLPASLEVTGGDNQLGTITTVFPKNFEVTVKDKDNKSVTGVIVTFVAPGSGATGTFGGSNNAITNTNSQGIATAPSFTANGTIGGYKINVLVNGLQQTVDINLTNGNKVPTVSGISPTRGLPNTNLALKVNGSDFASNAIIRWRGVDHSTTNSNGTLTTTINADELNFLGSAEVTVFNPAPGGGLSSPPLLFKTDLVVGDGNQGSCTDIAFTNTLTAAKSFQGSTISFNCPVFTFNVNAQTIEANKNITIDGGNKANIIFSGSGVTLFTVVGNATLTLKNLTVQNGGGTGPGGAISNHGSLTIVNTDFKNSNVTGDGGVIFNDGSLTISGSNFSNNNSRSGNGGVISNTKTLAINTSTFSSNSASGNGGAISNNGSLTIAGSTFSNNKSTSNNGGAMYNSSTGILDVSTTTFSGNSASTSGGGIYNLGMATIKRSTLDTNKSTAQLGFGGAIYNDSNNLKVLNSTFSGNIAPYGAAIFNFSGTLTVKNSTIADNVAPENTTTGYQITNNIGATFNVINTILYLAPSSNSLGNCSGNFLGTKNLVYFIPPPTQVATDCTGFSIPSILSDPSLGTIQSINGSTGVRILQSGSPARNSGDVTTCQSLDINNIDQTGYQRTNVTPTDTSCDIGAYEFR